ncbi:MAG: response regulator [Oligoflexia bacterium]|nr:response regulator [Oligoflexia bacterium]
MNGIKAPLRGRRIIVADDEDYLREVIGERLRMAGAAIQLATDGAEALQLFLKSDRIDFIVSDLRMPNLDGRGLIEAIRTSGKPRPEMVFITGFADLSAARALELGALALLNKPFDMRELIDLLVKGRQQQEERVNGR